MRRAAVAVALAVVVSLGAACGGSDGEASNPSLTRVEGGDPSTTTTEPRVERFNPDERDTRVEVESTTTTTAGVPEGGDPEQFCPQYASLEEQFASQPVYTQEQVRAIRSLSDTLPPELQDDLELVAEAYESIVGVSLEEMQDPARQAEVFPQGVTDALGALEAWVDEVC